MLVYLIRNKRELIKKLSIRMIYINQRSMIDNKHRVKA